MSNGQSGGERAPEREATPRSGGGMSHASRRSRPHVQRSVALLVPLALLLVAIPSAAHATSQWSRKYGVSCTTCHTAAFPRLNHYGEKFMRNGYQDLGTEDGDTAGKQAIGDRLFMDDVGNLFGFRLNLVPLRAVTDDRQRQDGSYGTRVDLGAANWLQLFTAGSISKNVSIFIETEVPFDGKVHNSWFRLGFHNLLGTSALNVWVGVMDPLELHVASGRLPMIPPIRQDVFYVKSSNALGDESLNLREGRPAVALYGSAGPLVYEVGVDNGPTLKDTNAAKNVWGTLRGELDGGPLEGSAVSVWGNWGRDSKVITDVDGVVTGRAKNDFWRVSPGANLRLQDLDVIAAWVYGNDANWGLAATGPELASVFHGLLVQAGHPIGTMFHVAAQFDRVWSDDAPGLELQKAGAALSYLPRENWRLMLVPRVDALPLAATHPRRNHELTLAIRTMF